MHLRHVQQVAENLNEIMQKKTDDGKIVQQSIRMVNPAGLYKLEAVGKLPYCVIISFPI